MKNPITPEGAAFAGKCSFCTLPSCKYLHGNVEGASGLAPNDLLAGFVGKSVIRFRSCRLLQVGLDREPAGRRCLRHSRGFGPKFAFKLGVTTMLPGGRTRSLRIDDAHADREFYKLWSRSAASRAGKQATKIRCYSLELSRTGTEPG